MTMEPNSPHAPLGADGLRSSDGQHWHALSLRLDRVEQVIESLLSDIRRRAAGGGPQPWTAGPTRLELARLEAARRLRESIEREMQATGPLTD